MIFPRKFGMLCFVTTALMISGGFSSSRLKAQQTQGIAILPEDVERVDEYGIPLTREASSTWSGIMALRETDIAMPTSGKYSNLSLIRQMLYSQSSIGNTQFARHGFHNFDVVMSCGGCAGGPASDWGYAVSTLNLLGTAYEFSAYFGSGNRIYDRRGHGNILERFVVSGQTKYRFIRNDGLIVEFLPNSNQSIYGPRMFYADKIIYPNGEYLTFSYDDLLTYSGAPQSGKRLKTVGDMFGNLLKFSYMRSSAQPDSQDIDSNRTISSVEVLKNGQSSGIVSYQYESFPSISNSSYRYIPRALSSVSSTLFGENHSLSSFQNQYLGSTLFVNTDIYPKKIGNYSGRSVTDVSISPSTTSNYNSSLTISHPGAQSTSYEIRTVGCSPNTNYSCTFYDSYPVATKTVGSNSTKFYTKDFPTYYNVYDNPSDPSWLDHAWNQQAYCDIDEAGTHICPYNRLLAKQVLPDGRSISYSYDGLGRLKSVKFPENNSLEYVYNERGFVTDKNIVDKNGSDKLYEKVGYSVDCVNAIICNSPIFKIDARGNRTDVEYSSIHGGVVKKTLPVDSNGRRPETRYFYSQMYGWTDAGGTWVQSSVPVWMLEREEACRTSEANANGDCAAGVSDKVVTRYEYEQGSPTRGSELRLKGIATTADGQTLRTCYGYDKWGRKVSETQPAANLPNCQ